MVDPHLARTIDFTNKQLRADLGTTLDKFAFKPIDDTFMKTIESSIGSTLTDLVGKGILTNAHSTSKVVDDKLVIDITLQPIFPVSHVTTTITLDPRENNVELNDEENEERRFQIYIENKSW